MIVTQLSAGHHWLFAGKEVGREIRPFFSPPLQLSVITFGKGCVRIFACLHLCRWKRWKAYLLKVWAHKASQIRGKVASEIKSALCLQLNSKISAQNILNALKCLKYASLCILAAWCLAVVKTNFLNVLELMLCWILGQYTGRPEKGFRKQ